jgi:hypothetical protein
MPIFKRQSLLLCFPPNQILRIVPSWLTLAEHGVGWRRNRQDWELLNELRYGVEVEIPHARPSSSSRPAISTRNCSF